MASTPEIEALQKEIAAHLEEWAAIFIAQRIAFLRKRKITATGELINSLEAAINQQARREAVELLIAFEEHGRFIDMKRLDVPSGGNDYVIALQNWILKKGFADKFIKKFMEKYRLKKVPKNVLSKIAWGILTNRAKRYQTAGFRRRRWYNKPKTAAISELFTQIAAMIPDKVAAQIKDKLSAPIQ